MRAIQDDDRTPMVWVPDIPPGGWVCAVADPDGPDGLCGEPVESEPCPLHAAPGPWDE